MWKKPTQTKDPNSSSAAQTYALRLLQLAWRSERELGEKLTAKGFTGAAAASAVEYAKSLGYVDDARLVAGIVRTYVDSRMHGALHLQAKLLTKKLSREVIAHALAELFGPEQEAEAARRAVRKLGYVHPLSDMAYADRQKLMAKLHARGFRPQAIRTAMVE